MGRASYDCGREGCTTDIPAVGFKLAFVGRDNRHRGDRSKLFAPRGLFNDASQWQQPFASQLHLFPDIQSS
jgi:hypothetical protein